MKTCIYCKVEQALVCFNKQPGNKDGLNNSCKKCRLAYRSAQKKANPRKFKNYHLKHYYNITIEQYDELYLVQGGNCAICKLHSGNFERQLHVDHCHKTGQVRGLLCISCNRGIGFLQDSRTNLQAADAYLAKFTE